MNYLYIVKVDNKRNSLKDAIFQYFTKEQYKFCKFYPEDTFILEYE